MRSRFQGRVRPTRFNVVSMTLWRKEILRYQVRDACIYWLVLPMTVLGSGWLLDRVFDWHRFVDHPLLPVLALVLIVSGCGVVSAALRDFARFGEGTANPRRPPRTLVRDGIYAFCRHPMFLGYDLAALGVVLLTRSPATLLLSYPVFLTGEILFLRKEERYLARRFGREFADYRSRVPFLLPIRFTRRTS